MTGSTVRDMIGQLEEITENKMRKAVNTLKVALEKRYEIKA